MTPQAGRSNDRLVREPWYRLERVAVGPQRLAGDLELNLNAKRFENGVGRPG